MAVLTENYKFLKAQANAIDKSKFIESQKSRRDLYFDPNGTPSQEFYQWWINNHAEKFRAAWNSSVCKNCSKVVNCKNCLKQTCPDFDPEVTANN